MPKILHNRLSLCIVIFTLFFVTLPNTIIAQDRSFTVSPGVTYSHNETTYSGMNEQINILKIDLNNKYAGVELGIADPLNTLMKTTELAKQNHQPGHRVVGAINASFFTYDRKLPMYLLVRNNQLLNTGAISTSKDNYVSEPIAFGIDANGKAKIDYFNLDLSFTHNNKTYEIESIDYPRNDHKIYLYTPNHYQDKIETNSYGMEFLIENKSSTPFESMEIGQAITGEVTDIRKYGENRQFDTPENGFVISVGGATLANQVGHIQVGDALTINTAIDAGWKDGQFLLGSGPLLVNNGEVDLTINPTSIRAKEIAPRTAVAVDRDKNEVFFVTVDGRTTNSKGMNLIQFANYLKSLGVDQALNLDGGGSSTMAVRTYGNEYAGLINNPSDGRERSVSASLQAISYAPTGSAATLLMKPLVSSSVLKGATIELQPKTTYILDAYFNNLPVEEEKFNLVLANGVGELSNKTYKATTVGESTIIVSYENARSTQSFQVVEKASSVKLSTNTSVYHEGDIVNFKLQAFDENGKAITYSDNQVTWNVPAGFEQISAGQYRITTSVKQTVPVSAQVGGKSASLSLQLNPTNLLLEDFENIDGWSASGVRSSATITRSKGFEPVAVGKGSLKLTYDNQVGAGTSVNYVNANQALPIEGKPNYIGMWVYGDSGKGWLRGKITDVNGDEHYISFTEYNDLTWQGWKYVKAEVPTSIVNPMKLTSIYLAQTDETLKADGTVFIDQIESIYAKNFEPALKTTRVYQTGPTNKKWTVEFNTMMDEDTINSSTVYFIDENGTRLKTTTSLDVTRTKLTVGRASNFAKHKFYKLVITTDVESLAGKPLANNKEMIFQVK